LAAAGPSLAEAATEDGVQAASEPVENLPGSTAAELEGSHTESGQRGQGCRCGGAQQPTTAQRARIAHAQADLSLCLSLCAAFMRPQAKKFPPAIPADESTAYINIRPMPAFPKEEIVSAKTPVEVTAIRQKNAIHLVSVAVPAAPTPHGRMAVRSERLCRAKLLQ
jgi:hypothetical protein